MSEPIEMMRVSHARGDYPVYVANKSQMLKRVASTVVITDRHVRAAVGLSSAIAIAPGERSKSMATFARLLEGLAQQGLTRKGTVSAVGGGVVGDLVGFVAASYMRGIDFVQVPTSLLAMVDSSVGGKVGIDLRAGKNLVGAFHAPREVWIVPEVLKTLPSRHLRNGLAEVLKYGFIMDPDLLDMVQPSLASGDWPAVIERSIRNKSQVVQEDEFEVTGRRAILNFGHTVGHAIESALGYRRLLHGEAVAIGMVVEAEFGEAEGVTEGGVSQEIRRRLAAVGLPVQIPGNLEPAELVKWMKVDKKTETSGLALSLLTVIGECKLFKGIDARNFEEFLRKR